MRTKKQKAAKQLMELVAIQKQESKCDYKTVSIIFGHSNISTTLNLYVHPNLEQKKKCIEQMAKILR